MISLKVPRNTNYRHQCVSVSLQISVEGGLRGAVEVKSCVVSARSDPNKSPFWTVISQGCSSDSSLTLSTGAGAEPEDEEEEEETEGGGVPHNQSELSQRREAVKVEPQEKEVGPLRFSFLLRPVHNDSVHFLHCSLSVCVYGPPAPQSTEETAKIDCGGRQRIPPLVSGSLNLQVQKQKTQTKV